MSEDRKPLKVIRVKPPKWKRLYFRIMGFKRITRHVPLTREHFPFFEHYLKPGTIMYHPKSGDEYVIHYIVEDSHRQMRLENDNMKYMRTVYADDYQHWYVCREGYVHTSQIPAKVKKYKGIADLYD